MAVRAVVFTLFATASIAAWTLAQPGASYRVVTTAGTQTLAIVATSGSVDMVTLDAVARQFGLTVRDDPRAGGAVVAAGTERIIIAAGQPTVSVGGRVLSLSAPIVRTGTTWQVPVDFLRALGRGIDVRRPSRLIVVPPAVVPTITPRFERTPAGGRLTLDVEPGVATRVTEEGPRTLIRFQAQAIDLAPLSGAPGELVADLRVADTSLVIEPGPLVTGIRAVDAGSPSRLTFDLEAPTAAPPPAAPPVPFDRPESRIRTVVIDPGHGGDDRGASSPDGALEKDVTLAVALRLKTQLESRFGLRVLLTRDGDAAVDLDRRAAQANNAKADLFLSLHANGSPRPETAGAQVLSLLADAYADVEGAAPHRDAPPLPVPVVGGGTRVIDAVPWQLAQLPQTAGSERLAALLVNRLTAAGIPMHAPGGLRAPLRGLVGANMPAVLIELGFLTNEDDARRLRDGAHQSALADAIAQAVGDLRLGAPSPASPGGAQ